MLKIVASLFYANVSLEIARLKEAFLGDFFNDGFASAYRCEFHRDEKLYIYIFS